jgi:hypothetical protein
MRDAYIANDHIQMRQLFAPGLEGNNITLRADPSAVAAVPGGYSWSADRSASASRHVSTPSWIIALVVVVGAVSAAAVAALLLLWIKQRRRRSNTDLKAMPGAASSMSYHDPSVPLVPHQDRSPEILQQLAKQLVEGIQPKQQQVPSGEEQQDDDMQQNKSPGASASAHPKCSSPQGTSSLSDSNVSAGLNNWRRAVNHTMLTIMQRRLEAQAPGLAGSSGVLPLSMDSRKSVGLQALPVVKAKGAARAGGLIPAAAPGMGVPMVLLENVLGRVSCWASALAHTKRVVAPMLWVCMQ